MFSKSVAQGTVMDVGKETLVREFIPRRWNEGAFFVTLGEVTQGCSVEASLAQRVFREMEKESKGACSKVSGVGLVFFRA
mgnify:CR=1 FL=1